MEQVLTQQIAGMIAAKAECFANPQGASAIASFFQGEPQTMRFVSTYSLSRRHRAAIRAS